MVGSGELTAPSVRLQLVHVEPLTRSRRFHVGLEAWWYSNHKGWRWYSEGHSGKHFWFHSYIL